MSLLDNITTRAKGIAITYPQVYLPRIAGAAVRSITGSSSKSKSQGAQGANGSQSTAPSAKLGHALEIGQPGERYAPALPDNGRTSGILVAQAAAAPTAPAQLLDQTIQPAEED